MTNWKRKINGFKRIAVEASQRRIEDRTEILAILRSPGSMADRVDKVIDYFRAKYEGTKYHGLPLRERLELFKKYDGRCMWCEKDIVFASMSVEHIIPLSEGGNNISDNLGCSCVSCNVSRHGNSLTTEGYLKIKKRKK